MRRLGLSSLLVLLAIGSPTKLVGGATLTSDAPPTPAELASRDCFPACSAYSGSPYCLPMGYDVSVSPKLKALRDKLLDPSRPIPASWLRANFDIPSDPCNRGDTAYSAGEWTNAGLPCRLSSRLEIAVGQSMPLQIDIPPRLLAARETRGSYILVRPRNEAVMLTFGDAGWNSDWGGELTYVAFDERIAMFQTPRGCISVDLTTS